MSLLCSIQPNITPRFVRYLRRALETTPKPGADSRVNLRSAESREPGVKTERHRLKQEDIEKHGACLVIFHHGLSWQPVDCTKRTANQLISLNQNTN